MARTPEGRLWENVRKGLSPFLRMQRIEDRYSNGIPDVMYAGPKTNVLLEKTLIYTGDKFEPAKIVHRFGWLELKVLKAWPKRLTTIVKLPKWRPDQKAWFRLFGPIDPHVFFLLKVEKDVLLFFWKEAVELGQFNKTDTMSRAMGYWKGKIDYEELAVLLLASYDNRCTI